MNKFNIIKDLKEKIVKELFLSSDADLTPSEINIINICSDIINSILDESKELSNDNRNLNIKIKNLEINFEDLLIEKEELKQLLIKKK